MPEDYQPEIPNEDDEEAPPFKNTLSYVHGRMYFEENRWIFESFKHVFQAKDCNDLGALMGDLYKRGISEYNY